MLVNLARNWFDPSASLREVRNNPHDLPDNWQEVLPKDAKILEEPKPLKEEASAKSDAKK